MIDRIPGIPDIHFDTAESSGSHAASAAGKASPDRSLFENEQIRSLPNYLKQFIVDQNYESYTPVDHAVWRYVLRQNHDFLREHAHLIYFEGLEKTGLVVEHIPSIEEMNLILEKIGWAAVCVNGFIPPAAFMGFQAHRVLVIAADMRQIEHLEYTPSPDIIHEAAGHAPVIADPEYAEYLRLFGEVGSKAMSSKKDFLLYEAIRRLSILKETPGTPEEEIDEAHKEVLRRQETLGKPSEMAQLSRLHWWTVEFGLIGDLEKQKIYGAGLLSSLGEASGCLSDEVKKIKYDIDAVNYPFDITTTQPHLFVTPDFKHLIDVLERFADTMAYRVGGIEGIRKAVECENVATLQYNSGAQVSGVFTGVETDSSGAPAYFRSRGPTGLAYDNAELTGHGKSVHSEGFGSPVGRLRDCDKALELMNDDELAGFGIEIDQQVSLTFESGVEVDGKLEDIVRRDCKNILMIFSDCRVVFEGEILFESTVETFCMTVGSEIVSVFSGAADKDAYEQPSMVSRTRTVKASFSSEALALHELYGIVRDFREGRLNSDPIAEVWESLKDNHRYDWLLPVEIVEILAKSGEHAEVESEIRSFLGQKAKDNPDLAKVINDGLRLAST